MTKIMVWLCVHKSAKYSDTYVGPTTRIMTMCLAPCFFVQISVLGYIKQLCKSKRCISENLLRPQHVRFDSFSKKNPMNNNWQMQKFLSSGRGYLLKASFCGVGRAPCSQTCLLHSYLISYAYLNSLYLILLKSIENLSISTLS